MATTRKYKNRKYKMKIQHGCSSKKYLAQNGGSNFLPEFSNKVLAPVPPALVGPTWSPTSIGSNHYALNKYDHQVKYNFEKEGNQINLSVNPWGKMWGGNRKNKNKKNNKSLKNNKNQKNKTLQKGGSFIDKIIPSDLLNIGRYASWNAGSLYNGYYGYNPPVNQLPWSQPLLLKTIPIPFSKHI